MMRSAAFVAFALGLGLTAAIPAGIPAALVRRSEVFDICPENPGKPVPDHHNLNLPLEGLRQNQCFDFCIGDLATCPVKALLCFDFVGYALTFDYPAVPDHTYDSAGIFLGLAAPGGSPTPQYTTENGKCKLSADKATVHCDILYSDIVGGANKDETLAAMCPLGEAEALTFFLLTNAMLDGPSGPVAGAARLSCKDYPTCSEHYEFEYWELSYRCTNCPPDTSTTSSTSSASPTSSESSTSSASSASPTSASSTSSTSSNTGSSTSSPSSSSITAAPTSKTTTEVVTYTITTCPVSKPCHEVTSTTVVTATLVATVTVPCETSTYVSSGTTMVTTITKDAITTYVTCPETSPTTQVPPPPPPKVPLSNATYPVSTARPVPTPSAKPGASPFTGGSSSLGISFGSLLALTALFGVML